MKICACVAEYNPLHLGHLKHLEYMKNQLQADKIIVIMSGNFTQRGEAAVLNKYVRARQAVIAGADMVIELPTVFATANAEIFARGAVKTLNALNVAEGLCFGVESGEKDEYITAARLLSDESRDFKQRLKIELDSGVSHAKARFNAVKAVHGQAINEQLINSPNNILGLEYSKALLKEKSRIEIFPMPRTGDHNDGKLYKGITSATSIRDALRAFRKKRLKKCVPQYVYRELPDMPTDFNKIIMSALMTARPEDMAKISDCTEGLENRIKALIKDNYSVEKAVEKISTKRYTAARVRRIFISNLLGITKPFIEDCLDSRLYAKVLAMDASSKDLISLINEKSDIPLITRKSDAADLKKTAKECFEKDVLAADLYNLATDKRFNEFHMVVV